MIQHAVEKEEIKRKIFHDFAILKPEAIIASNSSISITRLAASRDRPERFIGIHFMNPVPLMELIDEPAPRLAKGGWVRGHSQGPKIIELPKSLRNL